MKGLDRLVDMSRYRPTLTSSPNCTPEPSTAGSMRSPMAARNGVVGERALGSSSTAVPTPMGRSMQIVVPGGVGQGGLTGVYMRHNPQVQSAHKASCPLDR